MKYSGLISLRIDWFDLLAVQESLKSLLQHHSSKASILRHSAFFIVQLSYMPSKISRSKQAKWRRKWQSTSVLLPGKFHGWRSLVGYSSCGRNESDTTEQLHFLSFYSSFWRRKWQPIPVFLPEECHGRRGLMGYSLWSCKESETTKQLTHIHTHKQAKRIKHRAHFQEDNFNREVQLSVKKKSTQK